MISPPTKADLIISPNNPTCCVPQPYRWKSSLVTKGESWVASSCQSGPDQNTDRIVYLYGVVLLEYSLACINKGNTSVI